MELHTLNLTLKTYLLKKDIKILKTGQELKNVLKLSRSHGKLQEKENQNYLKEGGGNKKGSITIKNN